MSTEMRSKTLLCKRSLANLGMYLTNNIEVDWVGSGYPGRNLAFVNASISLLHIFDDQSPLVSFWIVSGQKPLVSRVSVFAHCENVNVSMPDPGDLKPVEKSQDKRKTLIIAKLLMPAQQKKANRKIPSPLMNSVAAGNKI